MKNKKGFTLIELLGVIVIIGLLLTIAVPAVQKYLKRGKRAYYTSIEGEMKAAGMDYMETYKTLLPTVIGNSSVVELDELVVNKYIDEVKDEKGNLCTGQVKITKETKNKYTYESCLNCGGYYSTNSEGCTFTEDYKGVCENNYSISPICTNKNNCDVNICDEKNNCSNPSTPVCTSYTDGCLITINSDYIEVEQGIGFLKMPYATVYIEGQERPIKTDLEAVPSKVDTSKLGTVKVVYTHQCTKKVVTVKIVDKKKPTQSSIALRKEALTGPAYLSEWYNGNVMAIFKSTDYASKGLTGSGIQEYQVYPGTEKEVVAPTNTTIFKSLLVPYELVEKEGEYTRYVRSIDKTGNVGDVNQYTYRIDKTDPPAPTITINGTPKRDNVGRLWFNAEKVPVTVTFTHNGDPAPSSSVNKTSGVKKIEYILSQATILTPNKYTEIAHEGTINLTNDGVTTIKAKVTDNAENISSEASSNVYIDTVAPKQATITLVSGTHGDKADPLGVLWYRTDVVFRLSYTEEVCPQFGCSGVEKMTYKLTKDTTKGGQETTNPKEVTIPNNGTVTINQDGITTITVYVYDYAGNRSEISKKIGRDTEKPDPPTLVKETGQEIYNGWHNPPDNPTPTQAVKVRVTSSTDQMSETNITNFWKTHEPTSSKNGEEGSGSFERANNSQLVPFTKSGVTKIHATTTDYAGNVSDEATLVIKIDKAAPANATIVVSSGTKTLQSSKWYTSNSVKVKITHNGDSLNGENLSGYKEMKYKLTGAQTQDITPISNNGEVEITRNGTTTVTAYVYDNVGNVSTNTFNVYLDNQKPNKPSITITPTSSKTTYYSGNISAKIEKSTTTDAHSGFGKLTYVLTKDSSKGGQSQGETGINHGESATINQNGITTVTAYEYDAAGNRSDPTTVTVYRDKAAPTASISINKSSYYSNDWYKEDVTATISCSDGNPVLSGPSTVYYKINNGSATANNKAVLTSGTNTLVAYCYDVAGNKSVEVSKKINIDKNGPSCDMKGENTKWTNTNIVTLEYYCSGDTGGSGCHGVTGSGCTKQFNPANKLNIQTSSNEISGHSCYAIDNAGNTGSKCPTKATANIYIDTTPPITTVTANCRTWGNSSWCRAGASITVSHSDALSGIQTSSYTVSGATSGSGTSGTISITNQGTTTVTASSKDKANNQASGSASIKYDPNAPTSPTINASATYNSAASITITAGTESGVNGSGYKETQYKIDSGAWTKYTGAIPYSTTGSHTIYAKAIDNAGNESTTVSKSFEIRIPTWTKVKGFSFTSHTHSEGTCYATTCEEHTVTPGYGGSGKIYYDYDHCEGPNCGEHCGGSSDTECEQSGGTPKYKCPACSFNLIGDDEAEHTHCINNSYTRTTTCKIKDKNINRANYQIVVSIDSGDKPIAKLEKVSGTNITIHGWQCVKTTTTGSYKPTNDASPNTLVSESTTITLPDKGKKYKCRVKYTIKDKNNTCNKGANDGGCKKEKTTSYKSFIVPAS